jgi:hypothetical protein
MIKFFRKIRQNLLMENKIGKYFKYAIGEIILVVIGILIALSINNWNEESKNNAKSVNYINRLIADISKDTTTINTQIKQGVEDEKIYKGYFEFLKQGNINPEHLKDSIDELPQSWEMLDFTQTTYNELISSGNFDVINEKKRIALIEYYELSESFKDMINDKKILVVKEDINAKKYLDAQTFIPTSFYKSINHVPGDAYIAQGLKHRHNAIEMNYEIIYVFKVLGPMLIEKAEKTIAILKK